MLDLIQKIHNKLDDEFRKGDLIREGRRDDGLNEFKFVADDPNNKFGTIQKDFVPVSYLVGEGQVQPNPNLNHEDGTINVSFGIVVDGNFKSRYDKLEAFKKELAGAKGYLDNGDKYILNPSPISPVGNQIINSVRVVMFEMYVFYQTTDKGTFGNFREYEVRPYFSEEVYAVNQLLEPPEEIEEPAPTDILVYEYDATIDGYIVTSDSDKTQLTNGILSIPSTYDDGVNGVKPVKVFDASFHQVSQGPDYTNPYLNTLYMNDNLLEFNNGVFINEITKENLRISKNLDTLPGNFLSNNNINGTYVLPDHIKEIGTYAFSNSGNSDQYGWPKNDITTFMIGKSITSVGGRFLMNNENISELIIFNETPPTSLAGAGDPLSDTIINSVYVPKNAITSYENSVAWGEYEIKPLLEASGYSLLSNLVKEMDYTDEEKEDIIYRIEYNKDFTEEEISELQEKIIESLYTGLERVESGNNVGTDIQPTQALSEREASAIKGHTVFGGDFTIYKQNDFFNTDLQKIESGDKPDNNVYVLRLKEEDQTIYERPVILETSSVVDPQGSIIHRRVSFRKADQILIDKEIARFENEQ